MKLSDYLSRIGKSRGFGIQSPWAYSFVREVIMEKWPYYAYDDIDRTCSDKKERKYRKLYLRVENFVGKNRFRIFAAATTIEQLRAFVEQFGEESAFILEGINNDEQTRQKWNQLKAEEWVGVTFDLYDVAICFARNKMYKQHYKLNF